jgi:hypothetical protein
LHDEVSKGKKTKQRRLQVKDERQTILIKHPGNAGINNRLTNKLKPDDPSVDIDQRTSCRFCGPWSYIDHS